VRRAHFAAFAPRCPACDAAPPLALHHIAQEQGDDISQGILLCPACQHEFPILDGIPIIVRDLAALFTDHAPTMLQRDDLDPALESLFGDALGPNTWFDVWRQTLSTYGWDHWADHDPEEQPGNPTPGAVSAALAALTHLTTPPTPVTRILDLGCAAGRSSFDLAATHPDALVLGIDRHLALLRLAQGALQGRISYPRRRIGLVYDRRQFPISPQGAERVDFWACDATALPLADAGIDRIAALNLLDCLPQPLALLTELARILRPGGDALLATPYDWSPRATPPHTWIGGHSQRAPHRGAAEPALHALLGGGDHPQAVHSLTMAAENPSFPWHTRLHDRATMSYHSHLMVLRRPG
jgi:SAM-dependent methyltransferase/uncharacterized protein YbaR (Trm112 family)